MDTFVNPRVSIRSILMLRTKKSMFSMFAEDCKEKFDSREAVNSKDVENGLGAINHEIAVDCREKEGSHGANTSKDAEECTRAIDYNVCKGSRQPMDSKVLEDSKAIENSKRAVNYKNAGERCLAEDAQNPSKHGKMYHLRSDDSKLKTQEWNVTSAGQLAEECLFEYSKECIEDCLRIESNHCTNGGLKEKVKEGNSEWLVDEEGALFSVEQEEELNEWLKWAARVLSSHADVFKFPDRFALGEEPRNAWNQGEEETWWRQHGLIPDLITLNEDEFYGVMIERKGGAYLFCIMQNFVFDPGGSMTQAHH